MSTLKSFLSILFISQTIHARSFNPCELEYELSNIYNLTTDESRNLTCVAQKYSQLTTNIINNGSKAIYYGIFQIGQKWCDIDKPGGKCNIKCEDLVDDDITDDIKCAQILFKKLGTKAWKLNKNSGCKKEFNYLDENCHKNANIDDTFQVQPDFCEFARKLMTLYDISKIDATIWSCISEYSKTGNLNLRAEEEDGRDDEESCVKTRDVECAIKHNKQTGISGFTNWPEYEHYCKNITESTCFKDTKSVNSSDIIEQIKNIQNAETSKQPKIFTTSTEVSVFIEDDDGNLTQYSDTDITSESPKESQQTTEFLSDTLEKPSYDDKPTIDGYSKVRIMSAEKNIVELPEALETTSKSLDEVMLIISSLAMSTSAELSHTKHTTEQIHLKYYETINKCALAKDMNDSGRIPQNLISTFICIAEHESGLNVSFIDSDGQQSRYGLFQIDNQIYCSTNDNINQCNVLCAHLVDDQFENDFECVRHIYKKEGLNYWPSYEKSCKNINSHSLDYCFEQFTTSQRPPVLNREAVYYSKEGTSEATLNEFTHMEMTTLINDVETAPSDGSLDFCEFSHQLKVNLSIEIWEDLVHYVCIADQISHLKPKLLNDNRLGIFGLKDNTCGKYQADGLCTILCSNLLNDDLIDDAECMIKVYKEHGLNEWNIDKDSCKPYTPKILNCIDEGRFSIPSDDEIDEKEDLSIKSNYKDEDIQKIIAEITQMILSRAKIGTESVANLEDSDLTTMASIETTSFKEDSTIESEIQITTKKHIQNEKDLENEQQTTTEAEKLDSTEKYQEEEEPEVAMKTIQNINTSEEIESTSFELKNDENDQNSSIKYDDDELNEKAIVELNLLTTTTESLLDIEVMETNLESNNDTLETTVKIEEVTQEIINALEISDKIDETEASDDMELTTMSVSELEESTLENDSNEQENNGNEQVSNKENDPKLLESSAEEEDQTFLEISTESARYQEIELTTIENDSKEQENNENGQVSNIGNEPEVLESSTEEEDQTFLKITTESARYQEIELTTMSVSEQEESTIEIDSKEVENNGNEQVSNKENDTKVLESSTEEEDQTFLEISTESAKYQEIQDQNAEKNEPEESTIENYSKEQENDPKLLESSTEEEDQTFLEISTESAKYQEIQDQNAEKNEPEESTIENYSKEQENDPKLLESSTEEEDQTFLEITTESAKFQKIENQSTDRNETGDPKRHQQNEKQFIIESETPKPINSSISDNSSNIESEITKPESNQATESYDNIADETTDAEMLQKELFSENIEKSLKEETTTDIPLNFDDKTESFEPEILSSDSLLKNTEKSTEEETTSPNVLNINSTESNESFSENTDKYIQHETTTENESISRTEEQIYLKSTTESSLTRNILDVTENLQELTEKLNEDINNQTTESDEQDQTELEESTVATTKSDDDSDIVLTTEETYPQPTTESLYYTSIREIIEEYQKSNVKNLDNIQSKRNQNYSDEETTLDDLLEDYDDYADDQVKFNQSIEYLNQYTTFPITPSTIKTPQYSRINKCELARYMNNSGFPENLIPTLICIAEYESELNPLAVKISKSHNRFGLFQIDDNIYCSTDEEIKECEVSCVLLTDNQYDNDFECVRHIYKKEGFNYWPSYEKSCKNVSTNALDYCYEDILESHRLELEENEKIDNFQSTTLEMSQIEDIPVTSDSPNFNLDTLSTDNESKSIVRIFDLCELTRELYSRNISIDDIPQYLCIADIKSDLKIKIPNVNDQNYGLFFINSEFCGQSESGGICSMKCSELWDSNISDDVDCVHKIIETNGTDKWNLNSKVCQIYDNKFLECFDKTTEFPKMPEIDIDGVQRNASISRHDVITESEKMTDMISDINDKNLEDLRQETSNLRSSNSDIASDEMTIDEPAAYKVLPIEQTTSKIIQILTSTASTDNYDSTTENVDKQIRRVPLVEINLPREILNDQNLSKQVGTLIKNFTYFDVLPNNGSIIFNIFNFNIYGENHDIEYTINTKTDHKDRVGD